MAQFRGIRFPFRKGPNTFPEEVTDTELIRQSIKLIVFTGRGERVMRPDFGSGVQRFVFANNDPFLETLVKEEVRQSISKFERRVIVQDIVTSRNDNELKVEVFYVIRATGQVDSVFDTVKVNRNFEDR